MSRRLNGSNLEVLRPATPSFFGSVGSEERRIVEPENHRTVASPKKPRVTQRGVVKKGNNWKRVVFFVLEGKDSRLTQRSLLGIGPTEISMGRPPSG